MALSGIGNKIHSISENIIRSSINNKPNTLYLIKTCERLLTASQLKIVKAIVVGQLTSNYVNIIKLDPNMIRIPLRETACIPPFGYIRPGPGK